MSLISKGRLLFHTVKYLRLQQLVYQIMIRIKPKESFLRYETGDVKYTEYDLWIDHLDSTQEYIDRFKPEGLIHNELTLLNETRVFDRWHYDDALHLWNFNVHYLEYLIALKAKYKATGVEDYKRKLDEILEKWYENGTSDVDSNQAYTISLRIVNMLLVADIVTDRQRLYNSMYAQYKYLLKHQEKHLLGNHYLENLKAIVICSIVYNDDITYGKYIERFFRELDEEITPDGLHFESSLMYHKIVLEDLIRVALILKQSYKKEFDTILKYIGKMNDALYSLENGIGRTLLFNDAGEGVSKSTTSLLHTSRSLFGIEPASKNPVSGYYRIDDGDISVLVDCGELSPRYMPGHAHCDCLSFELFIKGDPVLVNSGTYQYQGKFRRYFRNTSAHNTVMINDHEQSELWGEHRAAGRISAVKASMSKDGKAISGSYRNFHGESHHRKITYSNGVLEVQDMTDGRGKSYLHLDPGIKYNNMIISGRGIEARIVPINARISVEESICAPYFGVMENNSTIVFEWENDMKEHGYRIEIQNEV